MKGRSKWICVLPWAALWVGTAAQAAIPASERQALLNFYNSTGGSGWITRRPAPKTKPGVPPVGRNAGRNQNRVKPGGA